MRGRTASGRTWRRLSSGRLCRLAESGGVAFGYTARRPRAGREVVVRAAVRSHPLLSYVVLAYAISWAWWIPMALRGDVVRAGVGWPTHLPGLAGPALSAAIVTALAEGRTGLADLGARLTRWRVGWGWWALVVGTAAL